MGFKLTFTVSSILQGAAFCEVFSSVRHVLQFILKLPFELFGCCRSIEILNLFYQKVDIKPPSRQSHFNKILIFMPEIQSGKKVN